MTLREEFLAQFEDDDRRRREAALTDPRQTQFGGRFQEEWADRSGEATDGV